MGRYQRRSEVDAMMVEAYVSGVSQRKMGDVTEAPWVSAWDARR